jgi:DNA-binding PucR family transcriptional regulator
VGHRDRARARHRPAGDPGRGGHAGRLRRPATLCLLTDPYLLTEIGNRSLAPFDGLTSKRRARLGETLLAWLQSRSSAPDLATQLGVHPQTVRYRLRQLEELFGDRLNGPDERLNLEVTLCVEQLAATGVVFD